MTKCQSWVTHMVRPPRRVDGTSTVVIVSNSFRSLGIVIPNLKCYKSMRGEIIHRMEFVRGKLVDTLVMRWLWRSTSLKPN
jgi:hypothetical protein